MAERLGFVVIGLSNNNSNGFLFAKLLCAASNKHDVISGYKLEKEPERAASKATGGWEDAELIHR